MKTPESQERAIVAAAGSLVRRLWWFWALFVLGIAAAVVLVSGSESEVLYRTEALVVATELEVRVDAFPGTATAIFEGGNVAEMAAARAGTGIDPGDLVPEIARASPVDNTGVVEVVAIHENPDLAALYANTTAAVFVDELNRVGPGLGVFALHAYARVPVSPIPDSMLQNALPGLAAGLLLAFGVIALLAVVAVWQRSAADRAARAASPPSAIVGIGPAFNDRLEALGILNLTNLAAADEEWLASSMDIRPELAEDWIYQANSILSGEAPVAAAIPEATQREDHEDQ